MSNLEIIASLCSMLDEVQKIILAQAEILATHGIETADRRLEEQCENLLDRMERELGC